MLGMLQILDEVGDFCSQTQPIWHLLGVVVRIIQIAIPVVIILLGTIDLGKAVIASKDDEIKGAQKMFIKRLIYGLIVFFVVMVVRWVFSVVDGGADATTGSGSVCFCEVAGKKNCGAN